jgi:hypothetical protein
MKTAVEWLQIMLIPTPYDEEDIEHNRKCWEQAKEMEREQKILLVKELKDYTKESQCILGNDEREASEFVDIFYNKTFKQQNKDKG